MINHSRRKNLLTLLAERHAISVAELAQALDASAATIRRDLTELAASHLLKKVHGGAQVLAPAKPPSLMGLTFQQNIAQHAGRKRAIARRAVDLCHDGETIIINGGTTTFMMAEPLSASRLCVLTNSFLMAQALLTDSQNDILVPGGKIYREQNLIVSPFENDVIQNHYASKMFMGAMAVSPLGLLESDPLLVRAEIKLMKQAEQLIVLVDSTKFVSRRAGLIVCPLDRVHTVITDDGVSAETLKMLRAHRIEVIVVEPEGAPA